MKNTSILEKFAPVLFLLVIVLSVLVGILIQKVSALSSGGTTPTVENKNAAAESPLSVNNIKKMAKDLKLNTKDFNSCLDNGTMASKVTEEQKQGESYKVTGTPAFFINGIFLGGAYPYDYFQRIIDFELKGGNWAKPDATVKDLVDKDEKNGEISPVKVQVVAGDAPVLGSASAPIKIIEYSDFECPFCARFHTETYGQLKANYIDTGKVAFYFKQYPLTFHQYAQKAAEASLCAKAQGKFWEMHEKLFEASSKAAAAAQ